MAYKRKDSYYKQAKQDGFRSRAAFKLIEIDKRFSLFAKGQRIVDLGCAPGGWLQVASRKVGSQGLVVGIDRLLVQALPENNVVVVQGDLESQEHRQLLLEKLAGKADVVLSDMAPDTSGVGFADHANSIRLVRLAAQIAEMVLKPGAAFLAKVFDGPELNELGQDLKKHYRLRRIKPKATRKGSREIYLLCQGFR